MTDTEIVTKVKAILNEIGESESLTLLTEDTVKIEQYIASVLPDAVILASKLSHKCVNKKMATSLTVTNSGDASVIAVPDDYISLIALKLSGWKRIVNKTLPIGSSQYRIQMNGNASAGINKPLVFQSQSSTGEVLECYPSESAAEMFVYEAKYDKTKGLSAEDNVISAVCYLCASLVYEIFENPATAKQMQSVAVALLNESDAISN